ncbi:MAG: hypothetical protein AAGF81_18825, partial [Pseudomonadota bacterium]
MDFAAKIDHTTLLNTHGFSTLLEADRMPGFSTLRYDFHKEDHTQSVFTIAEFLVSLSDSRAPTLVILDSMYVWNSGRDEHLIATAFASMTDAKIDRLEDGSMFVWNSLEAKKAATLYHLAMLFGWDAYIYPTGGDVSAFISHDGFIELNTDGDP